VIPAPEPRDHGTATSVDGARIAWQRYGAGDRAVVFVPTWNIVDARVAGHQVEALAPHATVVTFDPRGAGASDRPATGYDFPMHAADALAVMAATGIEHAAIVTASRGLNTVVLLATDHPQRVERIAVIAPYMILEPTSPEDGEIPADHGWRVDFPGWVDGFMRSVISEPDSEEVIAQMVEIGLDAWPEVLIAQEAECDWGLAPPRLGAIACPTLVIHGEADLPVPASLARVISESIPAARLELLAGGGHRPDIRSPDLVNPLLLDFLLLGEPMRPRQGGMRAELLEGRDRRGELR
jgi:pimeloyl-ACP methyl ester carboxylesterase